jgi:hypothetical protein
MRRKRDLTTNEIKSHKARLNLHGGKQIYEMNYFETYAPVVTWFAIRVMIIFGIIFCWALRQVDFIMAYPQAPIEMDIYMELPQGIQTAHGNSKDHMLKLEKNIYGQKQAGRVWNSFLVDKLMSLGYTPSLSTRKTRLLTHLPRLWHKMTSNVITTLCVASNLPKATKVRECYENKVLWYLHTVLTYQSHITSL